MEIVVTRIRAGRLPEPFSVVNTSFRTPQKITSRWDIMLTLTIGIEETSVPEVCWDVVFSDFYWKTWFCLQTGYPVDPVLHHDLSCGFPVRLETLTFHSVYCIYIYETL